MSIYLQSIDNYIEDKSTCIWATNGDEIYFESLMPNLEKQGRMFFTAEYLWDCIGDIVVGNNIDRANSKRKEENNNSVKIYLVKNKTFLSRYYAPEILFTIYSQQNNIQIKIIS